MSIKSRLIQSLLILFLLVSARKVNAQDYYQGLGGLGILGINDIQIKNTYSEDVSKSTFVYNIFGIYYQSSFAFDVGRFNYFAVSAYPMVGLTFNSVGFEIPILAEFYFGDIDYSNFHFGIGYSYSNIYQQSMLETNGSNVVFGPQFEVGSLFPFRSEMVGLRLSFGFNTTLRSGFKDYETVGGFEYKFGLGCYALF